MANMIQNRAQTARARKGLHLSYDSRTCDMGEFGHAHFRPSFEHFSPPLEDAFSITRRTEQTGSKARKTWPFRG